MDSGMAAAAATHAEDTARPSEAARRCARAVTTTPSTEIVTLLLTKRATHSVKAAASTSRHQPVLAGGGGGCEGASPTPFKRTASRSKRAFSLPEDNEYRELWQRALQGAYTPPDRKTVKAHVVMLSKEGLDYIVSVNKALTETGLKVAIAGDIWSDRGVSILGICQYHIDENFKIHELVRRRLLPIA